MDSLLHIHLQTPILPLIKPQKKGKKNKMIEKNYMTALLLAVATTLIITAVTESPYEHIPTAIAWIAIALYIYTQWDTQNTK